MCVSLVHTGYRAEMETYGGANNRMENVLLHIDTNNHLTFY